ncbi:SAM-dependent methyltransferase [Actinoplanes sp. NPDC051851]|uniref:SAM-dependent methyltransferase n=1 Tax=Actinoplanes sp. NPDC051851 TaxID=3154753 RepID=UPI00341C7746
MSDPRLDTSRPHPARRYDYWLGGKDNFEADRESARQIEERMPKVRLTVHENRWFLHRAVRFLAHRGVRQFLDIGTGIPTSPNTHEIAQGVDPASRVVYADNDPLVLVHARALLTGAPEGRTAYLDADLREPAAILGDPQLRGTLDLTEPVGLLLIAILHFIRDAEDPRAILDTLIGALPEGSYVVATHVTLEYLTPEEFTALRAVAETQSQARSGAELAALFDHPALEPVGVGVQSVAQWWAEDAPGPRPSAEDVACNGIVLRVREKVQPGFRNPG